MTQPRLWRYVMHVAGSGGGGNFVLSTSISGYTPCMGATVAMVRDGYGCFYSIETDR